MMYGFWDMKCDEHNLLFSTNFYLLTLPPKKTPEKSTFKKKLKKKKHLEISPFYRSVPKIMIIYILFLTLDMTLNRCNCYFSLRANFCPFIPLTAQKSKLIKKKKMPGDIITFHMCTKNYDQMMYSSWDMVRNGQMDRQIDGRKNWHIEVGAPPKKLKTDDIRRKQYTGKE